MSEILKVYTPEQFLTLAINKILAEQSDITDFNSGSTARSILEVFCFLTSVAGFDMLSGIRNSVPIALYDGLGFKRKPETRATGFLRFFRLPQITMEYTGTGTDCLLTISATQLTTTCSGAAGDNLTLSFVTYPTISDLATIINSQGNYSATLVSLGTDNSDSLYYYSAKDIKDATNYLELAGFDIMLSPATAAVISLGVQVEVDGISFKTNTAGSIAEGESSSVSIASEAILAGTTGNISAKAIDTLNGKGTLSTSIANVEHVVNDSVFVNGNPEETADEQKERFQTYIQGLSSGTVKGLESAVLGITGIRSVTIRERYPVPGFNTVVADDGTGNLSIEKAAEIRKVLDGDPDDFENYPGARVAGMITNISAPDVVAVDVSLSIQKVSNLFDETEIELAVITAVETYINTRKLGEDVVIVELLRLAKASHPGIFDIPIQFVVPADNVVVTDSQLTRTGAGTGASVGVIFI